MTSKPTAWIDRERTGYFMLEATAAWVGRDTFGNEIARARTRKDCEQDCRWKGYTPRRA